jgi:hypothetical protein
MSRVQLKVNPKSYKLNVSDEALKNLKPYFQVSSGSYSSHSETRKLTNKEGKTQDKGDKDIKDKENTYIDLTLRDAISGELLGKGHMEYDNLRDKSEKYEEEVPLKDFFGNQIGTAIVEIEHHEKPLKNIEDEFRSMRRAIGGMMHKTNRMFRNFNSLFNRDFGLSLMDDFGRLGNFENLMLGPEEENRDDFWEDIGPWEPRRIEHREDESQKIKEGGQKEISQVEGEKTEGIRDKEKPMTSKSQNVQEDRRIEKPKTEEKNKVPDVQIADEL